MSAAPELGDSYQHVSTTAIREWVYEKLLAVELGTESAYKRCFMLLVIPGRYWMRDVVTDKELSELGRIAHDRFVESGSTAASDYADIGAELAPKVRAEARRWC